MSIAEKLTLIAENQQKVYDAGKAAGGYQDGYDAGKKAQYDAFWDALQQNGELTDYGLYAFKAPTFSFANFYPKYDIRPVNQFHYSFYNWKQMDETMSKGSLSQRLRDCGVTLDTSKATYLNYLFSHGRFTEIPPIDFTSTITASPGVFSNNPYLKTIEKIIVTENTTYDNWFGSDTALVNVTFEGIIGQNGLDLHWSAELSKASITSVVNALSETTSNLSVTLPLAAVKREFETAEGANDGNTSAEWLALAGTKSNWTITLS